MDGALIETPAAALRYMLGGKATLTLRSKRTDTRFTYRIDKSDDGQVYFVRVLNGPDNNADYQFLGTIFPNELLGTHVFRHSRKSRIGADAPSVVAFAWTLGMLKRGIDSPYLEIWHEGSCGRCGRRLTVPESIASGFGPECSKLME